MSQPGSESAWVVVGPHEMLTTTKDPDQLDDLVLRLLRTRGAMSLSALWKEADCHLWELDAALNRLKRRGLLIESELQ
jgi:hypothetical protein